MKYKRKDLDFINLGEKSIVIACDSCGGIGTKENDFLKVSPFYVGALTTRVVLFEVLSTGAEVVSITNSVCNEMNNTGKDIWSGVKSELKKAGVEELLVTGSTEENMTTTMTAVGMSCIGLVDNNKILVSKGEEGDYIVLYGIPKVGNELNFEEDLEIAKYSDLYDLREFEGTIELSATGSKGINHECNIIAKLNDCSFKKNDNIKINLDKSCGVSTCMIALIKKDYITKLPKTLTPTVILGKLGEL